MPQRTVNPRARPRHRRVPVFGAALLIAALGAGLALPARAAGVNVEVHGVDEALRSNVLAYLSFERYKKGGGVDLNADMVERLHNRVEREVQEALRPFGYYEPQVSSTVTDLGRNEWRVVIDITPGRPVLVTSMELKVTGPG